MPIIVNTTPSCVTVTETVTKLPPELVLLEDVLQGYQSEHILARRHRTTYASSAATKPLLSSTPSTFPPTQQPVVVPEYTSRDLFLRRPRANYQSPSNEGLASQYTEYVYSRQTITYISRRTFTATMQSTTAPDGLPSMRTTTVTATMYPANFTQKPTLTKTILITVYRPAQLQTAKRTDDEL